MTPAPRFYPTLADANASDAPLLGLLSGRSGQLRLSLARWMAGLAGAPPDRHHPGAMGLNVLGRPSALIRKRCRILSNAATSPSTIKARTSMQRAGQP